MTRTILALAAAAFAAATLGTAAAPADPGATSRPRSTSSGGRPATPADSASNDLVCHGGNAGPGAIGVEQQPAVYLVWWGSEWASGFQTADTDGKLYSSKTLQNYLASFFQNLGGSPWANIQTQYCNQILVGSTSCVGGAGFVKNPRHQLKGVWVDPTPVPTPSSRSGSRRTSSTTRSPPRPCAPPRTSATTRVRPTSS